MVFESTIEDPLILSERTTSEISRKGAGFVRRTLFALAGLSAFVGGAFMLNSVGRRGGAAADFPSRRRLHDDVDDLLKPSDKVQDFINEMLPEVQIQAALGERRRLSDGALPDDDTLYIGMNVNTDMFYIVTVMNGLGEFICAITHGWGGRCDNEAKVPLGLELKDITDLLQALRDSDDGLDLVKQFDAAGLAHAHGLVDKGAREATDALDELDTLFDVSTAMSGIQIAGSIGAAVLSLTPFALAGAFMSNALSIGGQLIEGFYTADEIDDAQESIATKILDMGKYAADSPQLSYIESYHDAENRVTLTMGKLYMPGGPLNLAQGSNVVILRRFLTGLARSTEDLNEMYDILVDFHNTFSEKPYINFQLWKDVANSMIDIEKTDITDDLINMQVAVNTAGVSDDLFSGVSNILLSTGLATASKSKQWAKQTFEYKARHTKNVRTKALLKLRALGEKGSKPVRKAKMYSRMTAGLQVMSAAVQAVSLGFKIATQDAIIDKLEDGINLQENTLKAYYTNMYEAIKNVQKEEEEEAAAAQPTPKPTSPPTPIPTPSPTPSPTPAPAPTHFNPQFDLRWRNCVFFRIGC